MQKNKDLKSLRELKSLSLWRFVILLIIIVVVLLFLASKFDFPYLANIGIGLATSLSATLLFYFMFARLAEERTANYIARVASDDVVEIILKRLDAIPKRTYPESDTSDKSFEEHFIESFRRTSSYFFKGSTASYAAYRLKDFCENNAIAANTEVRILTLDPRNSALLETHAKLRLSTRNGSFTRSDVEKEVDRIQKDIFISLIALYDIAPRYDVEMRFHQEFVFFRSEIFPTGMFLSYYDSGKLFPGSIYYEADSRVYAAYVKNFRYHYGIGQNLFTLQGHPNEKLPDILKALGCSGSEEDLRKVMEEKFTRYSRCRAL